MKNIPLEKLEEKCVDLLTTTYISLGQYKYDPETTMILAKKLARDLKRRYTMLNWKAVEIAFDDGINESDGFVNAHTWGKWLNKMKKMSWEGMYNLNNGNQHLITPELKEIFETHPLITNKQKLIK